MKTLYFLFLSAAMAMGQAGTPNILQGTPLAEVPMLAWHDGKFKVTATDCANEIQFRGVTKSVKDLFPEQCGLSASVGLPLVIEPDDPATCALAITFRMTTKTLKDIFPESCGVKPVAIPHPCTEAERNGQTIHADNCYTFEAPPNSLPYPADHYFAAVDGTMCAAEDVHNGRCDHPVPANSAPTHIDEYAVPAVVPVPPAMFLVKPASRVKFWDDITGGMAMVCKIVGETLECGPAKTLDYSAIADHCHIERYETEPVSSFGIPETRGWHEDGEMRLVCK